MSDLQPAQPNKPKRLFSIIALSCLLVCIPAVRIAAKRINLGEDMLGYGVWVSPFR